VVAVFGLGLAYVFGAGLNADEGFYLLASRLVADGLAPYRDFGFTQTPLLPYANLPWLTLFGFDLMGIRLAGLAWMLGGLAIGVAVLRRRGWPAALVFTGMLLASSRWIAFAVLGKTYAFAGLAVLVGTIALTSRYRLWLRWVLFLAGAAVGVAARLPAAGFFLPAGLVLLGQTPGWRARCLIVGGAAVLGFSVAWVSTAGAWESYWFWTVRFHADSEIDRVFADQALELATLAPAVWLAAAAIAVWARKDQDRRLAPTLGAFGFAVAVNFLPSTAYGEYVVVFVPGLAFAVAPCVAERLWRAPRWQRWATGGAAAALAFVTPPDIGHRAVVNAAQAASFLRESTPPGATVVASMPEIPVASGRPVPVALAMGKFALSEDLDRADAAPLHLLTPSDLEAMLRDPESKALVMSSAPKWNFSWSLPRYHWLSDRSRTQIFAAVDECYDLAYTNSDYVIFLRKPTRDDR
jgi:hypothetical protein